MIEAARTLAAGFDWTSAREVETVRARDVLRISSGAAEVDAVLGGGFETQAITEIYGEYRTGKTQLCHTLCVTAQLPVGSGGAAGKVAFVDAEGKERERNSARAERERAWVRTSHHPAPPRSLTLAFNFFSHRKAPSARSASAPSPPASAWMRTRS